MRVLITALTLVLIACPGFSEVYHVSRTGADANPGTEARPFATISAAASVAGPGDTITVHEGVYRERINPPRGGSSDTKRVVYQAAKGEEVVIRGSEIVKGWKKKQHDTWQVSIPNSFFGELNPYSVLIHGDWFKRKDRDHHTGAVYLNGHWLTEAAQREDVFKKTENDPLWFAEVDVYLNGAKPSKDESDPLVLADTDPGIKLVEKEDGLYLHLIHDKTWMQQERRLVTTEMLGKTKTPDLPYLNFNGSALKIDRDYFGDKRDTVNPYPGPFIELQTNAGQSIKVWPKK